MTTENLRLVANGGAYTEVDPSNHLDAATTTTLTVTQINRNESAYRYRDLTPITAGWFEGDIKVTLGDVSNTGSITIGFSDTVADSSTWVNGSALFPVNGASTTQWSPYVAMWEASVVSSAGGTALTIGTQYYYRLGVHTSLSQY
mgnify:FL=1